MTTDSDRADPVMEAFRRRTELRLGSEAMPDPDEEAIAYAAHVLSEWLDDAAPLNERRYREPAKAVLKFAAYISSCTRTEVLEKALLAIAAEIPRGGDDPLFNTPAEKLVLEALRFLSTQAPGQSKGEG